ncbi:MAG: PQQ-binding-like beta-propeller repeat protein, partial [Candidatus Tectomicrobia bacterium]|nr:PQQ-binding-like beta-propeller repeat protein [Candidatus Tectomicrobia bacterium]
PFSDRITWASGYTDDGKPIWTQTIPQEGEDPVEVWPSLLGGVNMYPAAYNPITGMIYLSAREMGMLWGFEKVQTTSNVMLVGATFELPPGGYELNKAVDAATGQETWRDQKSKDGYSGGMLSTAGGLVMYGGAGGIVHAVDAGNGEILWTFSAGVTFKAAPITYMVDGKQYVTIAGGGMPTFGSAPDDHFLEHGSIMFSFSR